MYRDQLIARDNPKSVRTALEGPEKVGILVACCRSDHLARHEYHIQLLEGVRSKPVCRREEAQPAAEEQSGTDITVDVDREMESTA